MTVEAGPATPDTVRFDASLWGLTGLVGLIWGASFLFIRLGVESFGAGLVPVMRIAFGALALVPFRAARRGVAGADWPRVFLLGVVWMALPFLLFSVAEKTVPTAITGMLNGAVPLATALIASISARRAPSVQRTVALLFGLAGVVVIARSAQGEVGATADGAGVAMLLVGVLCYGVAANLSVPLQRRYGALALLLRVQLVALALSLPYGVMEARAATFSWIGLFAMVMLGALGTGLAYVIASTLVGRTDATRGTIGVFLTPIVAMTLGVVVRGESLPPVAIGGSLLVLVGAVLTSRPEKG